MTQSAADPRLPLTFVVETDTDVRLVEGLDKWFDLMVLGRPQEGRIKISQPLSGKVMLEEGPPGRLAFARWVRTRLQSRGGTFVLVQGYGLAALGANLAARATGAPTAMLVCSPYERYYRCRRETSAPEARPFRRWELGAIEGVARVNARIGGRYVVLSDHLGDVVRGHGARGPIAKASVYGVDTEVFAPPTRSKADIRAERGAPSSGPLVFFSSRVAPEKDAETLLDALALLRSRGRPVHVLHRSGGYRGFLDVAAARGVADLVTATDAVHPVRELPLDYQACDLCVQASREEGLGFSPLEALACGTPVVASAVGGLRETIRDGETGWTYSVGDAGALANAIGDALDRPEEATRRAARGGALVRDCYARSVAFSALYTIVAEALGTERPPPSQAVRATTGAS